MSDYISLNAEEPRLLEIIQAGPVSDNRNVWQSDWAHGRNTKNIGLSPSKPLFIAFC